MANEKLPVQRPCFERLLEERVALEHPMQTAHIVSVFAPSARMLLSAWPSSEKPPSCLGDCRT